MNAPRTPIARDLRTVESHAFEFTSVPACCGEAIKPGSFYDAFKSTGTRPLWAVTQAQGGRVVPRVAVPAVQVRACDIRWTDNLPGSDWLAQREPSATARVPMTEALRRIATQQFRLIPHRQWISERARTDEKIDRLD